MNAIAVNVPNFYILIAGFHLKTNGAASDPPGNNGLHRRYLHTRQSQEMMLTGGLRVDLFEQIRYLANGISIKLRLHRQKDEYLLTAADNTFKIQVTEAFLTVRKVKISPGVQLGHTDALMKGPAKFPITRKKR